jgi:hypothetical protein
MDPYQHTKSVVIFLYTLPEDDRNRSKHVVEDWIKMYNFLLFDGYPTSFYLTVTQQDAPIKIYMDVTYGHPCVVGLYVIFAIVFYFI